MDVRIVRLYKLHIPKTISFTRILPKQECNCNYYYTMGHYDIIGIKKIFPEVNNILQSSYNNMKETMNTGNSNNKLQDICSSQSILVFSDGDEKYINDFWATHHPNANLLFVSMLHIADSTSGNNVDINSVLDRIDSVYQGAKYLYYFTFDYSDIIIFCKGNSINDYLNRINTLNYDSAETKYIKDSFSMLAICRTSLVDWFRKIKQCEIKEYELNTLADSESKKTDIFFAKFNLGVLDYGQLNKFVKELVDHNLNDGVKINQLGRHDFSIVNNNATLDWLLNIEYFIDKYTRRTSNLAFSTFEVFVGSEYKTEYSDRAFSKSRIQTNNLKNLIDDFYEKIGESNPLFYWPIREVENSINSIVKNGFADDFVICIYESFYRFVEYLSNKYSVDDNRISDSFINVFNEYFSGLTSLANSAMHSERSFIQATAFNAIFYDIPPKFMAFYTAIVYKIIKITKNPSESEYSFIFTPNFSSEMIVKTISDKKTDPKDRLFVVSINEAFFYNPSMVISTMVHETAHFAGDFQRDRDVRMEKYINCLICSVLDIGLELNISSSDTYKLIDNIREQIMYKIEDTKIATSFDFIELNRAVFDIISGSAKIQDIIRNYLSKNSNDNYEYIAYLNFINKDIYNVTYDSIEIIRSVFKEAHADLQMILLLKMSQKEYLFKMLCSANFTSSELCKDEHIMRFAVVCLIMYREDWKLNEFNKFINSSMEEFEKKYDVLIGIKKYIGNFYNFVNIKNSIDTSNSSEILNTINDVIVNDNDKLPLNNMYCFVQIYEYLCSSYKKSLDYYSKQNQEIASLRNYYEVVKDFKNIKSVYTTIRNGIDEYKRTLKKLHPKKNHKTSYVVE